LLLEALINEEHDVKKLILASSMAVYGEGTYKCDDCGLFYPEERQNTISWEFLCPECSKLATPVPTKEDKEIKPRSIYSISKRTQEEMCLLVGKTFGIPTVALRYFVTYGEGQSMSNPYSGVCSIWTARLFNGKPPVVYENGLQSRDFIYVKDIVNANMLALEKNNGDYLAMNVGTGKQVKMLHLAYQLIREFESDTFPKVTYTYRKGDVRHLFADISLIKQKLGFEPKVTFERGLGNFVNWAKNNQQFAVDKFDDANKELIDKKLIL
jgi:dTDP-L-rhamnose 4-epimerase